MEKKLVLDDNDNNMVMLISVIFIIGLSLYFAYSISKFTIVSKRSIVQNKVVMKIINHDVNSVCPACGFKGVPMCPHCAVSLYWNGYQGTFICPSCAHGGFPRCPKCSEYMSWIENK